MRAICGAIIAAGAMIGLGLACIGEGTRYAGFTNHDAESKVVWVRFFDMDTALCASFLGLAAMALIGLVVAFVGLSYYHHHRTQELLHLTGRAADGARRVGV